MTSLPEGSGGLQRAREPNQRRRFAFIITYYKPSGKYYTSEVVHWEIESLSAQGFPDQPYTPEAIEKLTALRDSGDDDSLPGLCGSGWDGYMTIQHASIRDGDLIGSVHVDDYVADGVSHLILPPITSKEADQ